MMRKGVVGKELNPFLSCFMKGNPLGLPHLYMVVWLFNNS